MTPQHITRVAGHPNNCLYIDSGASIHILLNKKLLGDLLDLDRPLKIQNGGKKIHLSQIEALHQVLRYLPLPVKKYHYSKNAITNLLSSSKLANEY